MLFCLLMKRVAKLTGAAVSMASGSLPILLEGTVQKLLHAYAEAFAARALHRDGFSWIGVSALALFVIFLIGIAWLYRRKLLTKTERNFLFVYVPLTGIVFYGINLVSHLTIFATETQYLEATGMIASIERYSAPFTVVSAVRDFSGTQSEAVGKNFALCSAGCSCIVMCKLGRCL